MENNEILNNEEIVETQADIIEPEFDENFDCEEKSGVPIGMILLGGAAIVGTVVAGVKLLPKGMKKAKEKIAELKSKKDSEDEADVEAEPKKSKYIQIKKEDWTKENKE